MLCLACGFARRVSRPHGNQKQFTHILLCVVCVEIEIGVCRQSEAAREGETAEAGPLSLTPDEEDEMRMNG